MVGVLQGLIIDKCGQRIDWIHDIEVPQFEEVTDCRRVKVGMRD